MPVTRSIVINIDYGGFSLSEEACQILGVGSDETCSGRFIPRDDPRVIKMISAIGAKRAAGVHATLAVVRIPFDAKWQIENYDGKEHIAEIHRTWNVGDSL